MKLSILIPSTHNRYDNFLLKILKSLYSQLNKVNQGDVEILTFIDNKERMLGTKRNDLINLAKGDFVVFVDDDDRVSENYISKLLETIENDSDVDVICFDVEVSLNGGVPKTCYYSKEFGKDYNTATNYYRLPNHIMCFKRELVLDIKYKDITYGEDSDFSKRVYPLIKKEKLINEILYFYDYSKDTTETQENR